MVAIRLCGLICTIASSTSTSCNGSITTVVMLSFLQFFWSRLLLLRVRKNPRVEYVGDITLVGANS